MKKNPVYWNAQKGETKHNEYSKLQEEIGLLRQEKDTLQAKLSSLPDLKKAYNILKQKLHEAQLAQRKANRDKEIEEGNRGYLLWQGEPTMAKKVKIEVAPVAE